MRHVEYRDLTAGALLAGLGLFVAIHAASHYRMGDASRMGPGFFPTVLGVVLVVLGLLIAALAFRKTVHVLRPPPFALRPLLAVLAAILVFSGLVERLGLVPAAIGLTFVVVLAERPFQLRRTLLLALGLALISWLIFAVGLQMTLPAFSFLG